MVDAKWEEEEVLIPNSLVFLASRRKTYATFVLLTVVPYIVPYHDVSIDVAIAMTMSGGSLLRGFTCSFFSNLARCDEVVHAGEHSCVLVNLRKPTTQQPTLNYRRF